MESDMQRMTWRRITASLLPWIISTAVFIFVKDLLAFGLFWLVVLLWLGFWFFVLLPSTRSQPSRQLPPPLNE